MPRCPACKQLARPNILMFGDGQWIEDRSSRQEHALRNWMATVERPAIVEIGAGTAIATVRAFAERASRDYRVPLIRLNPQPDPLPARAIAIRSGALAALQAIDAQLD
jgi:NAD-dependent SIR2 family protein deacetylase